MASEVDAARPTFLTLPSAAACSSPPFDSQVSNPEVTLTNHWFSPMKAYCMNTGMVQGRRLRAALPTALATTFVVTESRGMLKTLVTANIDRAIPMEASCVEPALHANAFAPWAGHEEAAQMLVAFLPGADRTKVADVGCVHKGCKGVCSQGRQRLRPGNMSCRSACTYRSMSTHAFVSYRQC